MDEHAEHSEHSCVEGLNFSLKCPTLASDTREAPLNECLQSNGPYMLDIVVG